jgi:hypothetical protein
MEGRERNIGDWYRELYRLATSLYPAFSEELFNRKVQRISQHLDNKPKEKGNLSEEDHRFFANLEDVMTQLSDCYKQLSKDCMSEYMYLVVMSLQNKPEKLRIPTL